jgi:pilus assembly protein Flp/PilA
MIDCDHPCVATDPITRTLAIMRTIITNLLNDESGATAIEYGLIAALIAAAAIAAFQLVGTNLSGIFNTVATKL